MQPSNVATIAWRWRWLILTLVVVAVVAVAMRLRNGEPLYEGQVKLQLTAPEGEDVDIFDRYRATSLRDEMAVARNNFSEVLLSKEVYKRTIDELALAPQDADYDLRVDQRRDYDFLYVTVQARSPQLAEKISNTHAQKAIAYYGELRVKPVAAVRDFLKQQLGSAGGQLRSAQAALVDFQIRNGISDLDTERATTQKLIEQLQGERNQWMAGLPTTQAIQATEGLINQLRFERERVYGQGDTALQGDVLQDRIMRFDEAIARYTVQLESLRNTTPSSRTIQDVENMIAQLKLDRERTYLQSDTTKERIARLDETLARYTAEYDRLTRTAPDSDGTRATAALLDSLKKERQSLSDQGDTTIKEKVARIDESITRYTDELARLRNAVAPSEAVQVTESLLNQLKLDRASISGQVDSTARDRIARFDDAISRNTEQLQKLRSSSTTQVPVEIDNALSQRRKEQQRLVLLNPDYNMLQENVARANSSYELLWNKHTEAVLKAQTAQIASYIQIVEWAQVPEEPARGNEKVIIALALLGSIGIGLLGALLLDSISRRSPRPVRPAAASLSSSEVKIACECCGQTRTIPSPIPSHKPTQTSHWAPE